MVDTRTAAESVRNNDWFERVARGGFAASGVLHLLIALIVLRLALGGGGNADQSGALATLAAQPGGAVHGLWVAAVALGVLGVWQLVELFVEDDAKAPGEGGRGRSGVPGAGGVGGEVRDGQRAVQRQ